MVEVVVVGLKLGECWMVGMCVFCGGCESVGDSRLRGRKRVG